ncbi:Fructosamine kinase-domain-containing protein [Russula vinacea]|nr:Fructosamine kinase-domain-containing protein [Russula vinacea]
MVRSAISPHIFKQLERIEPGAQFSGGLPQISSSEAESLRAMALAAPGLAPSLWHSDSPFFISEYKNMSPLTERSGAILGRRLATEMHNYVSANELERGFGFGVPTFCGATRLRNGWYETWERCFDVLIGDLLSTLERGPVLLHGDLWPRYGRMFGGIPESFFEEYHKHMPKTEPVDQYELRGDLYELFHYLNHTVLFGRAYASSAQRKMENLLRVLG